MVEINWSRRALNDLSLIAEFIGKDSKKYARLTLEGILNRVETLKRIPLQGRVVPELARIDIREIIFKNYRIIYRFDSNTISIITVHHSAQLFNLGIPE